MELADGKIGRNQILLLVNFGDIAPIGLLADYGNAVGILGPDPLGFRLSLFWDREERGEGSEKKESVETSGDKYEARTRRCMLTSRNGENANNKCAGCFRHFRHSQLARPVSNNAGIYVIYI